MKHKPGHALLGPSLSPEEVENLRQAWMDSYRGPGEQEEVKTIWGIPVVEVSSEELERNSREAKRDWLDGLLGRGAQLCAWLHACVGRVRALLRQGDL